MTISRKITRLTAASSRVPLMPSKTSIASAEKPAPPVIFTSRPPPGSEISFAPVLDRVEDPFALAVALDVGGDDRRLAVFGADRADEGRVVGGLAGDRAGRVAAAGRQALGRLPRSPGVSWCLPPAAAVAPSGTTPGKRFAVIFSTSSTIVRRSAAVRPDSRRKTITAGAISPFCRDSVAFSALVDSALPGQVGGRLVAFGVFELARQIGRAGGDEDRRRTRWRRRSTSPGGRPGR